MRNATNFEVMQTLRGIPKSIIEVTWCSTGVIRRMYEASFFDTFGDDEGKEILAGHHPDIVAVKL